MELSCRVHLFFGGQKQSSTFVYGKCSLSSRNFSTTARPATARSLLSEKEVHKLMHPEGPLRTQGSFGAKVSACYCLGLIGETIKIRLANSGESPRSLCTRSPNPDPLDFADAEFVVAPVVKAGWFSRSSDCSTPVACAFMLYRLLKAVP